MNAIRTSWVSLVVAASVLLAGCERPPVDVVQNGFRGTGMENVYNPRTIKKQESLHKAPDALEPADASGPRAKQVYKNVQVLGDLSVGEFTRVMVAMTQWVSPEQGCLYCHNAENFADDSKYTKTVARRMTQMTQHLNAAWKNHVGDTGVTCYTCHRGQPNPSQAWFAPEDLNRIKPTGLLGNRNNQNAPSKTVGLSTLPRDPFTDYFLNDNRIRQIPGTALPQGINSNNSSTQATEATYGLMIHMSESLGVNCTYCHNSRSFSSWETSPPRRVNAYHGIRMVRELNNEFIVPLTPVFPASELGPKGDIAKVNCATCHQGAYKPLYGEPMAKNHPELQGPAVALKKPTVN
jgi:photosynthetic reaction center cytochrome c subunit